MLQKIKQVINKALIICLGKYNTQRLIAFFKKQNIYNYDEAEWIYHFFKKQNKKGVMIDVGAHFGESFAPYLYAGWTIYAFEPDPNNYNQIKTQGNLYLFNQAISDRENDGVPFFSSQESSGISSLSAFRDSHREVAKVKVTTLRRVIESNQIPRVDYLKTDTEGHDLFCLKGFPFDKIKPMIIISEFEDRKTKPLGYSYKDLGDFLLSQGYRVLLSEWEPIVQYGVKQKRHSIRKYPCQLDNEDGWGNFIAMDNDSNYTKFISVINKHIKCFEDDSQNLL